LVTLDGKNYVNRDGKKLVSSRNACLLLAKSLFVVCFVFFLLQQTNKKNKYCILLHKKILIWWFIQFVKLIIFENPNRRKIYNERKRHQKSWR